MKMRFEFLLTAIILLFITMLFTCGSCMSFVPYSADSKTLKGYTFEPFGIDMGLSANVDANTTGSSISGGGAEVAGTVVTGAGIDVGAGAGAAVGGDANVAAAVTLPTLVKDQKVDKKEGFENMAYPLSPSVVGYNPSLDTFSQDAGDLKCIGKSSQLFNSKGGLCLTQDQMMLLQTRGGNASTGDAQYGAKI